MIKNNFDKEIIDTVVFEHSIEELVLKDKLILLNNLNVIQDLTKYFDKKLLNIMRFYIEKIKEYFNNFIIEHDNKYIFLYDDEIKDNYSLYIFNETKWQRETETILIQKLKNESFKKKFSEKYKIINKNELANIYGSLKKVKKTDDYNKFKIFFIDTGVVGATCISRTVHKSREDLQAILNETDMTKIKKNYLPKTIDAQVPICVLNETILRLYDKERRESKIWFMTDLEHAINIKQIKTIKK